MLPSISTQTGALVLSALFWITSYSQAESSQALVGLARLKDPTFECLPNSAKTEENILNRPQIYQILDCDVPGARWDYNYKTDSKCASKSRLFTGMGTITFANHNERGNFKDGFKFGKCLMPMNTMVYQIKGKFIADILEGPVRIEYVDHYFALGYSVQNQLVGVLRFFNEDNDLVNITDISSGLAYWTRDQYGNYRSPTEDKKRTLITQQFEQIFNCQQLTTDVLVDCSIVQWENKESNPCNISQHMEDLKTTLGTLLPGFKFNAKTKEQHVSNVAELYPECPEQISLNTDQIRKSIEHWRQSLYRQPNLHWFYEFQSEPLDLKNPRIQITFHHIVDRVGFEQLKVEIFSSERKLFVGELINGNIDATIPEEIARLPDWKMKIHVAISSGKSEVPDLIHVSSSKTDIYNPLQSYRLVASGTLRKGDNIAYVYSDMKTAFVGKFDKGLMVEGREAEVIGEHCNADGIKELVFSKPSGPVYHYNPPNSKSFGDQPLLGDPLENRYIELRTTTNIPEAGDGSFAKETIPPNTIYALYGGLILNKSEHAEYSLEINKLYEANHWTKSHPRVIDDWKYRQTMAACDLVIEIPADHGHPSKYRGTLGYKTNHSFMPNTFLVGIDSARFGIINAIKTRVQIFKEEEFTLSYGYRFDESPPWYKEQFLEFMTKYPNKIEIIEFVSGGRSKEELLTAYQEYIEDTSVAKYGYLKVALVKSNL